MLDLVKKNKDQEAEKFASEMLNPIGLINEYKQKYEPIINESSKAIVILGQDKADLNIIADLLKDKKLEIKSNKYGNLAFSETNDHNDKVDILNIPARENQPDSIIYNSAYLNNNHSFSQSILNIFFLQKILDTMPTKFILAIKNDQSPDTQNKIKELTNVLWEFTNLFETIDIGINNNISVVFTDTINNKTKAQISNIFNESLEERSFSEKQKSIIAKLACSTYFFPKPSNPPKYGGILKILYNKDYIIPNENNKITINYSTSEDILSTTNIINIEVKSNIHALKTEINRVWNEEKNTIFDLSKNQKLEQLIKILKASQARDNKDKTIENFLKVSDELYSILQILKPENDLNTLINYLKYFSNIKNFQENSYLVNPLEWFDNLFNEVVNYNINEELLLAFIATIDSAKDSFLKKLNEAVQNFYNSVKYNKTLDTAEINNIFKLREFLTKIKTVNIKNLEDIKTNLKSNLINLSLTLSIDKNITNLQNLINPINEEEAKSLWEYIIGSITEISKNEDINIVIYNKLLNSKILPRQEIDTYNKLETLLKDAYEAMPQEHKEEQLLLKSTDEDTYKEDREDREEQSCKRQLAEIYCQKAKIPTMTLDQSIELYKKAAEFGSVKANIELGTIELGKKNYSEAIKYLHLTPDVDGVSKAFASLINTQKSEIISKVQQGSTEDVMKLSLALTESYLEQAQYFKNNGLTMLARDTQELTRIAFFNIITATITIDEYNNNITLHNLYKCLSTLYSSLDNQLTFNKIAAKYKDLELKFNNMGKDEIPYLLSLKDIPSDYNEDSSSILGTYYNSSEYQG